MNIYVVQGDPRDHHGEILLVTAEIQKAKALCVKKLLEFNPIDPELNDPVSKAMHRDVKEMTQAAFLEKYLGSAWVCTPQLSIHHVKTLDKVKRK